MGFPFLLPAPRLAKCTIREYRIPVSSFLGCDRAGETGKGSPHRSRGLHRFVYERKTGGSRDHGGDRERAVMGISC